MSPETPPRLATWFLGRLLQPRDREAFLGDLVEEYALRLRSAPPSTVSRWYWGQVSRSILPMLAMAIRRERWLGTLAVAAGVYLVAYTVKVTGTITVARLLGHDPSSLLPGVIVGLTTMILGGYCAAWLRPRAAMVLAVIAVIVVAIVMSEAPIWRVAVFMIVGSLGALTGGTLCPRGRTRKA